MPIRHALHCVRGFRDVITAYNIAVEYGLKVSEGQGHTSASLYVVENIKDPKSRSC